MKKYLIIVYVLLLSGCISFGINREYKQKEKKFDGLVSNSFTENQIIELEEEFKELKTKVNNGDYSEEKKEKLNKEIDYHIMVLTDLKD